LAVWCDIEPEELSAFIDGEVTPERAAALGAHVHDCPTCRSELERARQSDDAVRRGGEEPSLVPMRATLLRHADGVRTRARLRVAIPAAAGIAAAFIIGSQLFDFGASPPPKRPGPSRASQHVPAIEALELDAASLRIALAAEDPDPAVRRGLDARLDAIVNRIEKLRSDN
jgi:anti-sigma factor RsiW